jgi:hypothetical protein
MFKKRFVEKSIGGRNDRIVRKSALEFTFYFPRLSAGRPKDETGEASTEGSYLTSYSEELFGIIL